MSNATAPLSMGVFRKLRMKKEGRPAREWVGRRPLAVSVRHPEAVAAEAKDIARSSAPNPVVEQHGTIVSGELKAHEVSDFPFVRCGLRPEKPHHRLTLAMLGAALRRRRAKGGDATTPAGAGCYAKRR